MLFIVRKKMPRKNVNVKFHHSGFCLLVFFKIKLGSKGRDSSLEIPMEDGISGINFQATKEQSNEAS